MHRSTALFSTMAALLGAIVASCSPAPSAPHDVAPVDAVASDIVTGHDVAAESGPQCTSDVFCSDALFCTGTEHCAPSAMGADARGCVAGVPPCAAGMSCDEAHQTCGAMVCPTPDGDGDGHASIACGGDDCDDTDPHRFPGNPEVCLVGTAADGTLTRTGPAMVVVSSMAVMMTLDANHDEDCDPTTFASATTLDGDHDTDHFVDAHCCNIDRSGMSTCGTDCADLVAVHAAAPFTASAPPASVHPTLAETCNGIDDDCNGQIDDGLPTATYYRDCDGDGFGDVHDPGMLGCGAGEFPACMGHAPVPNDGDCGDTRPDVHPGAMEVCDSAIPPVDENCNGVRNEGCMCTGTTVTSCCGTRGTQSCMGGVEGPCSVVAATEVCNGVDDNCDGAVDNGIASTTCTGGMAITMPPVGACRLGMTACVSGATVCMNPIGPTAEVCNGIDDNCDGAIDEHLHEQGANAPWSTLSSEPGCTPGASTGSCFDAIASFCLALPTGSTQCQKYTGFGPMEQSSAIADVACLAVAASPVSFGTLAGTGVACSPSAPHSSQCRAAAQRWCIANHHLTGYGPFAVSGGGASGPGVACLDATQARIDTVTWGTIATYFPSCTYAAMDTAACGAAAGRYCRAMGFDAGFGPTEVGPANAQWVCVNNF